MIGSLLKLVSAPAWVGPAGVKWVIGKVVETAQGEWDLETGQKKEIVAIRVAFPDGSVREFRFPAEDAEEVAYAIRAEQQRMLEKMLREMSG